MRGPWLWALLLVPLIVQGAQADPVRFADRESTYPAGVENITHEPWAPVRGEDVEVRLTLAAGAYDPGSVTILYCRIEPDYACALPVAMSATGDGAWSGVIPWQDAFMGEALHVGYNLTIRSDDGTRVTAPRGNHWVPDGYPTEVDGSYYFFALQGDPIQGGKGAPLGASLPLLAIIGAGCAAWRMRPRRAR